MALVLCPECGEETLDRLVHCPLCNEPLAPAMLQTKGHRSLATCGVLFLAGLVAATVCNSFGHPRLGLLCAVIGVGGLAALIVTLRRT